MKNYFYIDQAGNKMGPVPGNVLPQLGVQPSTYVWCEGMADWLPAAQVAELQGIIGGAPVPPPQQPQYQQPSGVRPQNYMVWAILITVLGACNCLPLITGIIAIVYASQVNSKWAIGDFAGSQASSNQAKTWCIVTTVLVVVCIIVNIISANYWMSVWNDILYGMM